MKYKTVKTLLGIDPMIRFNLLNYGKRRKRKKNQMTKPKTTPRRKRVPRSQKQKQKPVRKPTKIPIKRKQS